MGFLAALAVNLIGGAAIYATGGLLTPAVAPMLGFGSAGIAAGTTAAAAQAYYGNLVAGSIVSQLTAAAMVAPTPQCRVALCGYCSVIQCRGYIQSQVKNGASRRNSCQFDWRRCDLLHRGLAAPDRGATAGLRQRRHRCGLDCSSSAGVLREPRRRLHHIPADCCRYGCPNTIISHQSHCSRHK